MTSTTPSTGPDKEPKASKRASRVTRTTRAFMLGGLAAGVGFAAVTGVSAAAGTGSSSGSHSSTGAPAHPPRGLPRMGWPGPDGPGGIGGPGGPGGPGGRGEGTILKVTTDGSGYELTVRTLRGTETVVTTSSTEITGPDLQSTSLSSSDVGRVVRIQSKPPAPPTSRSSSSSSSSSSGTIDATGIQLVDPSVMGRVLEVGSGGYTLVGRDGQEITVTTTSGTTRYLTGRKDGKPETTTSAPSYSVGEILFVSGTETKSGSQSASRATTTIAAVLVGKAPAGPVGPPWGGPPWGGPNRPRHLPAPPSRSGGSAGSSSASAA